MSNASRVESRRDSHLILEASWFVFGPIWKVEEARHQGDDQDLHGSCYFCTVEHTATRHIHVSKQHKTNGHQKQSTRSQTKVVPSPQG